MRRMFVPAVGVASPSGLSTGVWLEGNKDKFESRGVVQHKLCTNYAKCTRCTSGALSRPFQSTPSMTRSWTAQEEGANGVSGGQKADAVLPHPPARGHRQPLARATEAFPIVRRAGIRQGGEWERRGSRRGRDCPSSRGTLETPRRSQGGGRRLQRAEAIPSLLSAVSSGRQPPLDGWRGP